jgi:hypothetical protein
MLDGLIYIITNSPLCRRCGAEEETSAHFLCEHAALAALRHVYLGSFFLGPKGINNSLSLGAIWNFIAKEQGCPEHVSDYGAQRAHFQGLGASGP